MADPSDAWKLSNATHAGKEGSGSSANVISGLTAIYLIGVGLQFFIVAFILGKRQVIRMSWSSRKAPHLPFGQGAPAEFRSRIQTGLRLTCNYKELPMFTAYVEKGHPHWYRYKLLDDINMVLRKLRQMKNFYQDCYTASLMVLLRRLNEHGWLCSPCTTEDLAQITNLYEKARYKKDDVTKSDYETFRNLYDKIFSRMSSWPCVGHQRLLSTQPAKQEPSSDGRLSKTLRQVFKRHTSAVRV